MKSLGHLRDRESGLSKQIASRGDLTGFLMTLSRDIGADSYMLVAVVHDQNRNDVRIVASNWIYDAIQLAGRQLIANIAQSHFAARPGARAMPIASCKAPAAPGVLSGEEARLLEVLGHGEIYVLKLHVGRQRLYLLFSAAVHRQIDPAGLSKAQLHCCYALSEAPDLLAAAAQQDPLSDRERECLYWVSEGKTTEDIAMILGVSANTVNSYITHAIQKFAASNRAMAVATAIRSGIL